MTAIPAGGRPLDAGPSTLVAADALTMKVREGGRVVKVAVMVATGVNADGYREILGVAVSTAESGAGWNTFFKDLVDFMTSGPVMIQVLQGENAIQQNRDLMGATDPKKAARGTIRADFAQSIDANAVHGSDSAENAAVEIAYFFPTLDICPR